MGREKIPHDITTFDRKIGVDVARPTKIVFFQSDSRKGRKSSSSLYGVLICVHKDDVKRKISWNPHFQRKSYRVDVVGSWNRVSFKTSR
jgi:hypothetical protein